MESLPFSWSISTIGEVSSYIQRGKSPKYSPRSSLPVINQRSIRWHGIIDEYLKYVHEDQFAAWGKERYVQAGDILWNSTGTGTIGRACLVRNRDTDPPKVVDSHVTIVRPLNGLVDAGYLFAWIRSPEVQQQIEDLATGTTNQIELSRTTITSTPVPLAPLNEQRRITAKLDTTLAAVDACCHRLDGVAATLKRFRQAVLEAATSGELTREWREERDFACDRWTIQDLCLNERYSLCIGPFGSNLKVSDYEEQGVPLVFVREIRNREFGGLGTKYVTPAKARELIAHQVRPGDLLLTKMGDPPGDTAIYPDELQSAIMTSDVVCIRPDPLKIDKVFLAFLLESPSGRDLIQGITAGVAQQKISLERLRTVVLMVPSLLEQQEIIRYAQGLFTLADQLEAKLTAARKVVDRLTPALLAKAFRGELVPQDPSDEPASVLLDRIRAARQVEAGAGKPARRGRPKAAASPATVAREAAPVPADCLAALLRECGALSERALLAASELEPARFRAQLALERQRGAIRDTTEDDGQVLLEASA